MRQLHRYLIGTLMGLLLASALAVLSAQPSGQGAYPTYQLSHLNSNTTTQILTGTGVLHTLCINTKGSSSNVATFYDNTATSGTIIAAFDTTVQIGCFTYDLALTTGLRSVLATGGAADMTVSYRPLR